MQPTPLLLRQVFRFSSRISNFPRPKSLLPQSNTIKLLQPICLRCQYRVQFRSYSAGSPSPTSTPEPRKDEKPNRDPGHGNVNEAAIPKLERLSAPARDKLPSQEEDQRSHLAKRFSHVMDNLQANVFIAGQRLNDLTGYSGIEALKKDIEEQELAVRTTRASLRKAKTNYTEAITQRSASQREVNELLQRKHAWTPVDLERFTSLYRSDHANEQAEHAAQEQLAFYERTAEEAASKLSRTILARYHEEQIWSDKIRRMSTWGTWGLMGVNVLLFLVFQVLVEPWRRKRLVKGFEEKVREALEKDDRSFGAADGVTVAALGGGSVAAENVHSAAIPIPSSTTTADSNPAEDPLHPELIRHAERPPDPSPPATTAPTPTPAFESWREYLRDLFSDRVVVVSQRDLTTVALEGAAAGAALVGFLVVLLRPK